jgi:hypothetical protein
MNVIDVTIRTIRRGPPFRVAETMQRTIEACARAKPHTSWKRLTAIDWEADVIRLSSWLTALLLTEPPSNEVRSFYFGLFNPIEKRKPTAELYVAGYASKEVGDKRRWWPDGRYSGSRALRAMYREAYDRPKRLGNDAEYPLGLSYALLVSASLASNVPPPLWLRKQTKPLVAAGFDSGDILVVGRITRGGFVPEI